MWSLEEEWRRWCNRRGGVIVIFLRFIITMLWVIPDHYVEEIFSLFLGISVRLTTTMPDQMMRRRGKLQSMQKLSFPCALLINIVHILCSSEPTIIDQVANRAD